MAERLCVRLQIEENGFDSRPNLKRRRKKKVGEEKSRKEQKTTVGRKDKRRTMTQENEKKIP